MPAAVLASRAPAAIAFRYALYAAFFIFLFFPVYWMVATSMRLPGEIFVQFPSFFPTAPTLDNFIRALSGSNLRIYLLNSLITAGGSACLTTSLATLAAFGFAKYKF